MDPAKERIYSFNTYLRGIFHERVQRIGLDAGFSCPNLDGTSSSQGCSYCNNKAFVFAMRKPRSLDEQISQAIDYYSKRFSVKKFIAYFQAFTNTWGSCEQLRGAYDVIRKYPQIVGLFISTRPDCVDKKKLRLISEYKKDYLVWLEYGLQTTDDKILEKVNRNHTYADFVSAVHLSRSEGLNVCVHMIVGLPGSGPLAAQQDVERVFKLDVQGIKFHIFHILKGTLFEREDVSLMSRRQYVETVCNCLERLPTEAVVMRLVATADKEYLVAPAWINDKHAVIEDIKRELVRRETYQGFYYDDSHCGAKPDNRR